MGREVGEYFQLGLLCCINLLGKQSIVPSVVVIVLNVKNFVIAL